MVLSFELDGVDLLPEVFALSPLLVYDLLPDWRLFLFVVLLVVVSQHFVAPFDPGVEDLLLVLVLVLGLVVGSQLHVVRLEVVLRFVLLQVQVALCNRAVLQHFDVVLHDRVSLSVLSPLALFREVALFVVSMDLQ